MQKKFLSRQVQLDREVVLGILRYTQGCFPVKDFPPMNDPAWKNLWFHVSNDPRLMGSLSRTCPFVALRGMTSVDPITKRVSIDLEGPHGRLIQDFNPDLAHYLFKIGWETRGFVQIS